jgi:rfaE bifunctional protein kinase chain/domain
VLTRERLQGILAGLPELSVLVIGDYFLDRYLIIDPALDEPSLETGLVAYQVVEKRPAAGAAGTVTNNLRALGVGHVFSLGIIGDDGEGYELRRALRQTGVITDHLIVVDDRATPTYVKPMVREARGEREINRLDIKNRTPTPSALEERVIRSLNALIREVDAVIVLDQVTEAECGVITTRVREHLQRLGREHPCLPIVADSRRFIGEFRNVIVKCNQHESIAAVCPDKLTEITEQAARNSALALAERTQRPVFVTRGSDGQLVVEGAAVHKVPAFPVEGPIDIVGAGDATTAGIVCALASGATLVEAAYLGNLVASITIRKLGTTGTASPEEVLAHYPGD